MIGTFVDRLIRRQGWLEGFAEFVQGVVGGFFKMLGAPGRVLKSFLHGTFIGHALHPLLTDIPLGAWSVALIADIVAMTGHLSTQVGDFCVLIGVLGALGAAVTGYTDFHETEGHERRVGALHGLLNTIVLLLYVVSLYVRWQGGAGSHSTAFWVSVAGYVILTFAAYLGGHLVFGMGTMVNRSAFLDGPDTEYVTVGQTSDFPEGQMKKVSAGGLDVLVVRHEGKIHAISNVCSHAGGPLDEGSLEGAVVTCPWHASQFRVDTGVVLCGPATFSQPLLVVRDDGEAISVRLAEPLHG